MSLYNVFLRSLVSPRAAYEEVVYLSGPALAWEYIRRGEAYWLSWRRWSKVCPEPAQLNTGATLYRMVTPCQMARQWGLSFFR